MDTGRRIKEMLDKRHITVEQIAKITGKTRATIYRYINGDIETMPTFTLKQIAEVLGVNPGYLMGWTDNPSPDSELEFARKFRLLTEDQRDTILTMIDMFIAKNSTK